METSNLSYYAGIKIARLLIAWFFCFDLAYLAALLILKNKESMKPFVVIQLKSGPAVTFFTNHITFIEHGSTGCNIHFVGGEVIATGWKWTELANTLGLN